MPRATALAVVDPLEASLSSEGVFMLLLAKACRVQSDQCCFEGNFETAIATTCKGVQSGDSELAVRLSKLGPQKYLQKATGSRCAQKCTFINKSTQGI